MIHLEIEKGVSNDHRRGYPRTRQRIPDADRAIVLDKGVIVANGTMTELRASKHPRVRQFLDRVPEPEISEEMDYLQMLTGETPPQRR